MSDIVLTAGVRQNLLSLQNTAQMMSTTQNRLATGKKVNSALDNPISYFTSQSLNVRANDLNSLLDSIGQAQQTLKAADNGITAMTGRQDHPGTGKTLSGADAPMVDLPALVRALGVRDVAVVDPYDIPALEADIKRALAHDGPSVLITRRPCMLIPHETRAKVQVIADDAHHF